MNTNGRIEIVMGCMWSGKSTELIRQAKRYSNIGKKIIIVNHNTDIRYGNDVVSTHDSNQIKCLSLSNLNNIKTRNEYLESDIILIDEGQFFKDLYDFAVSSADIDNKTIIVFGLDGDFKREPFGDILKLIPHAEKVEKLNAFCNFCKDGTIASFTKRTTDDKNVHLVGTSDKYIAVCRYHYNNPEK